MRPLEIAQTYFDAWNQRDGAAIAATFAPGGTYQDPASQGPLQGEAIAAYAAGLFAAFPDLSFEIVSASASPEGLVSAEWVMRGTNSAPFMGLPPTGKSLELPGADFIRVDGGKIVSVQGYFDGGELPRQLGLQVVVQPHAIGPFRFGTATHASSGKTVKPGAFSITVLHVRSEEETGKVREYSRHITTEMMAMPEYIGSMGMSVGHTMVTLTAWENPDGPRKLLTQGTHAAAMRDFFGSAIGAGVSRVFGFRRASTLCGCVAERAGRWRTARNPGVRALVAQRLAPRPRIFDVGVYGWAPSIPNSRARARIA